MKRYVPLAVAGVVALIVLSSAVWAGGGKAAPQAPASGVDVGGSMMPFQPTHVAGPDAGTQTCPVCKYGARPAVQVWFNTDSMKDAASIARDLDQAVTDHRSADLKGFLVFIHRGKGAQTEYASELRLFAKRNKLRNVAVTYVSAPTDDAVRNYRINTDPKVKNTVFVYRDRKVATKIVNLMADARGLSELSSAIRAVTAD
jgi:hypothetical protein